MLKNMLLFDYSFETCSQAKILLVAPQCSDFTSVWFSPGRQRKLSQIETIFQFLDLPFIRISTSPILPLESKNHWISLTTISWLPLRFFQILLSSFYLRWRFRNSLSSQILWLYNTRFTEALVAWILLKSNNNKFRIIIQLEDLPSARRSNSGVRGFLDLLATRWLASSSTHVCSVSRPVGKEFERLTGFPDHRIVPLPPLLDPEFLRVVSKRCPPFARKDVCSIMYAGGYDSDKGVNTLITAFQSLKTCNFTLHLYGPIPVALRAKLLGFSSIIVHGQVSSEELFKAYSLADVVVNPHLEIQHSNFIFPFKLVEIMASGALPLSTPMPGLDDYPIPPECLFQTTLQLQDRLFNAWSIWKRNRVSLLLLQSEVIAQHSLETAIENLDSILCPIH